MKKLLFTILAASTLMCACAQKPIKLNEPNLERGKSLMHSLSERQSVREYSDEQLSLQDLSDLLWAANGINRPDGKRTAPSALNRQDIALYVAMPEGTYKYDHIGHALVPIAKGDHRQKMRNNMPAINILVVADDSDAVLSEINAGYVSQNIYLACTALEMATVAAGTMDQAAFKKACKLNEKQRIVVQHPVGYPK